MNPILFNILPAAPSPDVKPAPGQELGVTAGSSSEEDVWQEAFLVAAGNTGPGGPKPGLESLATPVVELPEEQEPEGSSNLLEQIFRQVPALVDHPVEIKIVDPELLAMLEGRLGPDPAPGKETVGLNPDGHVHSTAFRPEQTAPAMPARAANRSTEARQAVATRPVSQSLPAMPTEPTIPATPVIPDSRTSQTMLTRRAMPAMPANQAEPAAQPLPVMKPMPAMSAMPANQAEPAAQPLPVMKPMSAKPTMQPDPTAHTLPTMKSVQHVQPVQNIPTMQANPVASETPVPDLANPAPITRKAPVADSSILQVAKEQLQSDMKQTGVPSNALQAAQSNAQATLNRIQKSLGSNRSAPSLRQSMAAPEGKQVDNSTPPGVHTTQITKGEQIRQLQSQGAFHTTESTTTGRNNALDNDFRQAARAFSGMRTVSTQPAVMPEAAMSLSNTSSTSGPTGTGLPQVVHYTNLADAIMARAQAMPNNGQVQLRFSLEPEDLGMVKIQIRTRGDHVRIEIAAASGQAAETLQHGVARLTSQLEAAGYKNPDVQLSLDTAHDPTDPNRNAFTNHERRAAGNGNQGTDGNRTGHEHRTETMESSGTGQAASRRGGLNLMA